MTRRTDSTVVLLDRDGDGALCGRPIRHDPRSRYLLALGRADSDGPAVALAATDVARLIAALATWLAESSDDPADHSSAVIDSWAA